MTTENTDFKPATTTSGWVVFAGVITAIAATINLIYGLTLVLNPDWIVLTPEAVIRFDVATVGVIMLVFAAFQFFVAMGIFHGELWARVLGITGASLNAVAQMAFLSVYPSWSWLILIADGLIIYGLTVHGDEVAEF